MADLGDYNASKHLNEHKPVTTGQHLAELIESPMKPTKAGTGSGMLLKFQVTEGECTGQTITKWINWTNPNPQAVLIGKAEFGDVCRACGIEQPKDSYELHHITVLLTVENYPDTYINKAGQKVDTIRDEIVKVEPRGTGPTQPAQAANDPRPPVDF